MSIIYWRKCIKCGKHYDIGVNFDTCYECRKLKESVQNGFRKDKD